MNKVKSTSGLKASNKVTEQVVKNEAIILKENEAQKLKKDDIKQARLLISKRKAHEQALNNAKAFILKDKEDNKKAIKQTEKQKLAQIIKDEEIKKVTTLLGTKIGINDKIVSPSNTYIKLLANINLLSAKGEDKTLNESKRLFSAISKKEFATMSKMYKYVQNCFLGLEGKELQDEAIFLSGSVTVPNFKIIAEFTPVKFSYSFTDISTMLMKSNPRYKLAKKIEAQNKKVKAI